MNIIDTSNATWRLAQKTSEIRAKPLSAIIQAEVTDRFLLDTLEGREPLGPKNVMCVGAANDVWQQTPQALLKKYSVIAIDDNGWMVCQPKPDNAVQFYISAEDGYVQGHWGETVDGVPNLQWVNVGDAIARQPHDVSDQWCVRRKLFDNTYLALTAFGCGADVYTPEEFQGLVDDGAITPDDGSGYWSTSFGYSRISVWQPRPWWTTHVVWFNK